MLNAKCPFSLLGGMIFFGIGMLLIGDVHSQSTDSVVANYELELAVGDTRAGLNMLPLGWHRSELVFSLSSRHWFPPHCKSEKTALRGTGRLFLMEQCRVEALSNIYLLEQSVKRLDLVLIDHRIVRIDVVMSPANIYEEILDTSLSEIAAALDLLYVADLAVQNKWGHQEDLIRLRSDRVLQFLDGQLEQKLPELLNSQLMLLK